MRFLALLFALSAIVTAAPSQAANQFITKIDIAGHGVVNSGGGVDRPPDGTPDNFWVTIDFPGPYHIPIFNDGVYDFTTYPGNPGYGLPFSLSIGDSILGPEPTGNSSVRVIVSGGAVTGLGVDARTFLPLGGIDTNQWLHASFPYAYYYGGFNSLSGYNFYTIDAIFDRIDVTLAEVPEPETWSMLLLGFGVIGTVLRRRSGQSYRLTA